MFIVLAYDVNTASEYGQRRLRKVAKLCENYGVRVQNSVFELEINLSQLAIITNRLEQIIDMEKDSVRFYRISGNWENKVTILGRKQMVELKDAFII